MVEGEFGREFARIGLLFCVCIGRGCRGSQGMRIGMRGRLEGELARGRVGCLLLRLGLCEGGLLVRVKSRRGSGNDGKDLELM